MGSLRGGVRLPGCDGGRDFDLSFDLINESGQRPPGGYTSAPRHTAPTAQMSEREDGKDRRGGDYLCFDVRIDHIEDCEADCKADTKCAAWTYVRPAVISPKCQMLHEERHSCCFGQYMLRVWHKNSVTLAPGNGVFRSCRSDRHPGLDLSHRSAALPSPE
jgi:PAN domain